MKDYTKWNWGAISELMKGSLLNPKRFDELVRNTKFASRMIHFLKPSSKQFCELPVDEVLERYFFLIKKL
jgi:rapamycin-insensitive companion of mTOR